MNNEFYYSKTSKVEVFVLSILNDVKYYSENLIID